MALVQKLIHPSKQLLTECTTFYETIDTKDALRRIAIKHKVPIAEVVRLAIKEFLIRYEEMQRKEKEKKGIK